LGFRGDDEKRDVASTEERRRCRNGGPEHVAWLDGKLFYGRAIWCRLL
jgi:hypothetical protein